MNHGVTDDDMILDRINYLLEGLKLPFDIRGVDDLRRFLDDEHNKGFGVYSEIKDLYERLMNQ